MTKQDEPGRPRTAIVVGGGVVGASTAFALHRAGIFTTLITAAAVGDGATSSNAGLLVPADSLVWPSPENARAVLSTISGSGNISINWREPGVYGWGTRFLASCTRKAHTRSSQAAHMLSSYSVEVLEQWQQDYGLRFGYEHNGMVFLTDSAEAQHGVLEVRSCLQEVGESYRQLSREELVAFDPAYAHLPETLHVTYAPHASHADAALLTRQLVEHLRENARVIPSVHASKIIVRGRKAVGVATSQGDLAADIVVVAAGIGTRALARSAGVPAAILPVKGYAATVPIPDESQNAIPWIGGVLESEHIAFSRTHESLRLATGAEIGTFDTEFPVQVRSRLRATADRLFSTLLDWPRATYEAGHRPMTPSGRPLIGPTCVPGLYLNSGHGSLGWTQAAGSAALLTQLVLGQEPALWQTFAAMARRARPSHAFT